MKGERLAYLIGIGGIGMSALARYFKHEGYKVAGYDRTPGRLTQELESEGIEIFYTDSEESIPKEFSECLPDIKVIYTPAIPVNSRLLNFFKREGVKLIKRSQALGEIALSRKVLAVAGTHGKTTTSTLLAHILQDSGIGCTAFLGGISKNYNSNLLLSKNELLVAEADEFDRSFLQLWPDYAIVTSIDPDHLDIYKEITAYREAFKEFILQVKPGGSIILKDNIDESVLSGTKAKVLRYSYGNRSDYYASNITVFNGGYYLFDLNYPGGVIKECTLGIPGWINVENCIAASAIALLNGVTPEKLKKALGSFKGVERRFDIRINSSKCSYIDDYAHHPSEISAAISSIRTMYPSRKLTAIFQPHLYTRTRDFAKDFAFTLSGLDSLILLDIYPAREKPIEGVTSKLIYDDVKIGDKRMLKDTELMAELDNIEIDVLITFGAGDIDHYVEPITNYLKKRYNV